MRLKTLYRGSFHVGGVGTGGRLNKRWNQSFPATKSRFPGSLLCDLKKGDRNVQSEPESRPAEPEPRTETGPTAPGPGPLTSSRIASREVRGSIQLWMQLSSRESEFLKEGLARTAGPFL